MNTMKAILFNARHSHPAIEGLPPIFSGDICPTNFAELDRQAHGFFAANRADEYTIYVTGLTAATVAVIKAAIDYQVRLTLMHYDRELDTYAPQRVVTVVTEEQPFDAWGVNVPVSWK